MRCEISTIHININLACRKRKLVTVDGGTLVPYDHLVLCTGQQYQVPAPSGVDIDSGITNDKLQVDPGRRYAGDQPRNVFTINDAYDAAVTLYWVENNLVKKDRSKLEPIFHVDLLFFFNTCTFV